MLNLKQIFTEAHEFAKTEKENFQNYATALSEGLKKSWVNEKIRSLSDDELEALKLIIISEQQHRKTEQEPATDYVLNIDNGCIDQGEIDYDSHGRAKNWVATVEHDPKSPGGLARNFWKKASGSYREQPAGLEVGDIIEIAADYYTGGGKRRESRCYLEIVFLTDMKIGLKKVERP